MEELDRPVWASLTTYHAGRAEGGALARRFAPEITVFAGAVDESDAALAELAGLVGPGETLLLLQVPAIRVPPALERVRGGEGVQMVAKRDLQEEAARGAAVETLTTADAADMLALARLADPGPFLARTHEMGRFVGVRAEGALVAMAGERMRFPGYCEVSGVCTHPAHRGRGLARLLSTVIAAGIQARGEVAFLHAWIGNRAARALYESLGFELRAEVAVAALGRP